MQPPETGPAPGERPPTPTISDVAEPRPLPQWSELSRADREMIELGHAHLQVCRQSVVDYAHLAARGCEAQERIADALEQLVHLVHEAVRGTG